MRRLDNVRSVPSDRRDQVNPALIAHSGEGDLASIRRPGRKPIGSGRVVRRKTLSSPTTLTYTSWLNCLSPLQTNATCLPSGENAGIISKPVNVVSGITRGGGSSSPSRASTKGRYRQSPGHKTLPHRALSVPPGSDSGWQRRFRLPSRFAEFRPRSSFHVRDKTISPPRSRRNAGNRPCRSGRRAPC